MLLFRSPALSHYYYGFQTIDKEGFRQKKRIVSQSHTKAIYLFGRFGWPAFVLDKGALRQDKRPVAEGAAVPEEARSTRKKIVTRADSREPLYFSLSC